MPTARFVGRGIQVLEDWKRGAAERCLLDGLQAFTVNADVCSLARQRHGRALLIGAIEILLSAWTSPFAPHGAAQSRQPRL